MKEEIKSNSLPTQRNSLKTSRTKASWARFDEELKRLGISESKGKVSQPTNKFAVTFRPFEEKLRKNQKSIKAKANSSKRK